MERHTLHRTYIRLPLFLIERLLRETKSVNMLRLYLYLNSRSSGHFRFSHGDRKYVADILGITPQLIGYNLERLRARNWVGYNPQKDLYHIRGFRAIKKLEHARGRQVVEVNVEKELNDKKTFEALLWGAYIGNFIRSQERKAECKRREECHKGGSKQKRGQRQAFFPVAVSVIARCLGVSISTACVGRALAVEYGYLDARESLREITYIEAEERSIEGGKEADVVRRIKGRFYVQETHQLKIQNLHYCRMSRTKKHRFRNAAFFPSQPQINRRDAEGTSPFLQEPLPF
ncbi:MAG: hypothetical protein KDD01_19735 [Phaeodactylibacter sp.]|nr:hypothetical protein [Phaeodactylibacter sp.]